MAKASMPEYEVRIHHEPSPKQGAPDAHHYHFELVEKNSPGKGHFAAIPYGRTVRTDTNLGGALDAWVTSHVDDKGVRVWNARFNAGRNQEAWRPYEWMFKQPRLECLKHLATQIGAQTNLTANFEHKPPLLPDVALEIERMGSSSRIDHPRPLSEWIKAAEDALGSH